ncbi:MAG: heme-binding protein [Planctomycetia bacterium]
MKSLMNIIYPVLAGFLNLLVTSVGYAFEKPAQNPRAVEIRQVFDEAVRMDDVQARNQKLMAISKDLASQFSDYPLVLDCLGAGTEKAGKLEDPSAKFECLRKSMLEAFVMLGFKPKMEAPLPEGYPQPTPVGKVEIKTLPVYRLARVADSGNSNKFMTLFYHIQKNKIEMTAPVEMTMKPNGNKWSENSMAFLYQSTALGSTGTKDKVDVIDSSKTTVASIGMQGKMTPEAISKAKTMLVEYLQKHPESGQITGDFRVLGYNSPFMPAALSYYEVQYALLPANK